MNRQKMLLACSAAMLPVFIVGATLNAQAVPIASGLTNNLIVNGSFENGLTAWSVAAGPADRFSIDLATGSEGRQSLKVDGRGITNHYQQLNVSQDLKLKPATRYLLQVDIKRSPAYSGNISVIILEKADDAPDWIYHNCGNKPSKDKGFNVWEHFETTFITQTNHLNAHVRTYNSDFTDATVWYDNFQLVELGARALVSTNLINLAPKIRARQAKDIKLWVNGQPVNPQAGKRPLSLCESWDMIKSWVSGRPANQQAGQWPLGLREGLNVIAMTAAADGANPGLRLRIPGQPELETRWRVGVATNENWLSAAFDDRAWKKTELDKDGYLLMPPGSSGQVCFRQIVLWGENHYSGLPCLQPKVREWGFSEKSMETLFHVLYSPPPLTFALEDYEFVLDVPKGFSLLAEKYPDDSSWLTVKGGKLNRRAKKVTAEEVQHDSQPYTRYRLAFESAFVMTNKTQCALIPLVLNEYKLADKACKFYFRRLASGNLTELEQTLPVRVLPPINGRLPKKVLISQYIASPWLIFAGEGGGRLFPEHFNAYMRQSLDAGFNCWILGAWEGAYGKKVYDKVIERGGAVVLSYNNYPIHGNNLGTNSALGKWMQAVPEARARFFNETAKWTKEGQYCPSFVTGEGAAQFKAAVKKDIGMMLHGGTNSVFIGMPKATMYWTDWEEVPWIEAGMGYRPARTGDRSYCFCARCKQAFRAYAKLPETTDLADDIIWKSYKDKWNLFRYQLDGRINGITREACNELGMQYIVYTGVHDKQFWTACKGQIDSAFPGCPGDGAADCFAQKSMDDYMDFFREKAGMPQVIGQLFASAYPYSSVTPWGNWSQSAISGKDGFNNVKSLKAQILRLAASFHGGVDLCSSLERCAGQQYYIGEATRIISEYEELFWSGERADQLAASGQIKYPNLLVLRKGAERLVLLFNEGPRPVRVLLENKELTAGQKATIVGASQVVERPEKMELTVGADDVAVVHIQ